MSRYETRLSRIRDITVAQLGGDIILHEMWGRHQPKSSIRVLGENDGLSIPEASSQGAIWIAVICSEAGTFMQAGSISYSNRRSSSDAEFT